MSYYKDIPLKSSIMRYSLGVMIGNQVIKGIYELSHKSIIISRAADFYMVFHDSDGTYFDNLSFFDEVVIYVKGTLVFRGVLESWTKRHKRVTVSGRNYWVVLMERYVNEDYATKTASEILTDIFTDHCSELSQQITATTITYDREYRNVPINEIAREFCELEGFQAYVDISKNFVFEPEGFTDSGKTFNIDTGEGKIYKLSFEKKGTKLKNIITVYGDTGGVSTSAIVVQVRNAESIEQHGEKTLIYTDNSLATEEAAEERAKYILNRYSTQLETGKIELLGDETINSGDIVYITSSEHGYSGTQFLVVGLEHSLPAFKTVLTLADFSVDVTDLLESFLRKIQRSDASQSDYDGTVSRFEYFSEEYKVSGTYFIEKQTTSGIAQYGSANYSAGDVYGPVGGGWVEIDNGDILITNDGLNLIRNWLAGDSVNAPDNTNGHIAIGTGTTAPLATDTTLESELGRKDMDGGYPSKPEEYKVRHQSEIGTSDYNGNILSELGLFNNDPAGTMLFRQVFDGIDKNATFGLKIITRLTISRV